ncbi:hypothetical protein AG1IA_05162 [Rhizoctonia solani AG-1 IA]|uniref:Uncharacterized protein n=1 Tax=Thanatephorus cucumeris (strain AG1-IA) TaxID=983506 RepID=L8WRT7_THACA|nr:hypothetical protein AG1IA_05162 [Rhizoctonia solani AG-1 IA]
MQRPKYALNGEGTLRIAGADTLELGSVVFSQWAGDAARSRVDRSRSGGVTASSDGSLVDGLGLLFEIGHSRARGEEVGWEERGLGRHKEVGTEKPVVHIPLQEEYCVVGSATMARFRAVFRARHKDDSSLETCLMG